MTIFPNCDLRRSRCPTAARLRIGDVLLIAGIVKVVPELFRPVVPADLASGKQFIGSQPPPAASDYPEDRSENANSIVLLLRFGEFEFLDAADLTLRLEAQLVQPVNLPGKVDVYQVNHHGLDQSNNPALINAVEPTVTVMNNGHRKGCGPRTRAALKACKSVEANYQLHKNLKPGADQGEGLHLR